MVLAGILAAGSAHAQEVEDQGDHLLITFDEVDGTFLTEFIAMYQRKTGKVIHYEPNDVKDVRIHQLGTHRIPIDRLDIFFGAVLRNHEFLLVQFGPPDAGFWSLRKVTAQGRGTGLYKALAQIIPPSELSKLQDNPGVLITTSYTTKYLPARDAVNTLQPYFSDNFTESIRNIEGTDTILMTGFANTLGGLYRLLTEIDQKPDDYYPQVVRRELQHAVSDEIQPVLEELIQAYHGNTRSSPGGGGRRGGQNQQGPGSEPEPQIIADHRSNSLLITAGEDSLETILAWIDDLDVEVEPSGIHVYRLRNSKAEDMSEVLMDIMEASQRRRGGTTAGAAGGAAGGGGRPAGGSRGGEQPVSIVPDTHTNSLVISASKTRYAQVLEIVRKLDIRPAQVLIQAALVEVSNSLGEALGVELTGINIDSDDKSAFGVTSFGLTTLIDTDSDGFPDAKALPDPLASGLTGGVFDPNDFPLPFVLNALKNSTEANVLSMPSILTNDNEEATITATDTVPFTSTNQGQNSDQTSLGGQEDAGIQLTISPTISAGGYLSMSINLEISTFTGASADPNLPPPEQVRTLDAKVTIPDGHTMIIGGVLTNNARRDEEKIPILGDLPLIGFMFRNANENASKTNLYFFLTPHIIADDFAILDELTRLHMEEAERLGGKVDMLNRFQFLSGDSPDVQQVSDTLLEQVFELPSYASVADESAAPSGGGTPPENTLPEPYSR